MTLGSHPEPEARGGTWEKPPAQGQGQQPGGVVATQAQEGLEELSNVEGQERLR